MLQCLGHLVVVQCPDCTPCHHSCFELSFIRRPRRIRRLYILVQIVHFHILHSFHEKFHNGYRLSVCSPVASHKREQIWSMASGDSTFMLLFALPSNGLSHFIQFHHLSRELPRPAALNPCSRTSSRAPRCRRRCNRQRDSCSSCRTPVARTRDQAS